MLKKFLENMTPETFNRAIMKTDTNPSTAEIFHNTYRKGEIQFGGFGIRIENPKGSTRSGIDENGDEWSTTMQDHYGEFINSGGADADGVDVFVGDDPESKYVLVVNQTNPDGSFDEHKVMLGYKNKQAATAAYKRNYDDEWLSQPSVSTDIESLKGWLISGDHYVPFS